VIDLARRFGARPPRPNRSARIVIAALNGQLVGLVVSAVTEVLPIATGGDRPAAGADFEPQARFVAGWRGTRRS